MYLKIISNSISGGSEDESTTKYNKFIKIFSRKLLSILSIDNILFLK
jgi:hypothetical protein